MGARIAGVALVLTVSLLAGEPVFAQDISISLGESGGSLTSTGLSLFLLVTVLSLAPGIAIMVTCFPLIVTVLSILRQAIGLQQSPPNMLIVSLAIFLTYFIMEPVFMQAWAQGLSPFIDQTIDASVAFERTMEPFRQFMLSRVNPDTVDSMLAMRAEVSGVAPVPGQLADSVLVASFMLSEITRAFQIGFLIFMPFLIIDLVVAAVLMSMGMMMVPPSIVALPFKLGFFTVVDGWNMLARALAGSYL